MASLLAGLPFLIVAALALYLGIQRPFHNWDMIGYIAAVKAFDSSDAGEIHAYTYQSVRKAVPAEKYRELTELDHYRRTISTDPSALKEHLPFYQIRPVYNGLILALHRLGIDIVLATHLISAVSVALALAVLWLMVSSVLPPPWAMTLPVLAVIFGALHVAVLSTPDGLAFLITITAAWLYWSSRHTLLFFILPVLVATRTDFILFALPLLLAVLALERQHRVGAIVSFLACLATYHMIVSYWANPGWAKIFHFAFIQILTHPLSTPTTVTLAQYLEVLGQGMLGLLHDKAFLLYLIFAIYPLVRLVAEGKSMLSNSPGVSRPLSLSLVCTVFVVLHFLAFPVTWDRFFAGTYLIGCVACLALVLPRPAT